MGLLQCTHTHIWACPSHSASCHVCVHACKANSERVSVSTPLTSPEPLQHMATLDSNQLPLASVVMKPTRLTR
jgi:hypothetical protein